MSVQKVYVNGNLVDRAQAVVSVWDRGFQSGDGVYEGLRVYSGGVFRLHEHIARLVSCARALDIPLRLSNAEIGQAILDTVAANNVERDAHIRITVTRGDKPTTGMDTRIGHEGPPTMVIIVEPKAPPFPKSGITLITSSIRRTPAQCLDPKLHTLNQLGQIMAKMEANHAGAGEALMLDIHGFVAETNSANVFIVKGERISTPRRDAIMPGLTRGFVIDIAPELGYRVVEENISTGDVYAADEMFLTGTVNEIVPIIAVDGRVIGDGRPGPAASALLARYIETANAERVPCA